MGVVNINDRDCIRTYFNFKRKHDRTCIQKQMDKVLKDIEMLKDKNREIIYKNGSK